MEAETGKKVHSGLLNGPEITQNSRKVYLAVQECTIDQPCRSFSGQSCQQRGTLKGSQTEGPVHIVVQ